MSLKAKVEAVVYAAEEPVTLAQLAGIFANEVLEELQAAANRPAEAATEEPLREGVLSEEPTDAELFAEEQREIPLESTQGPAHEFEEPSHAEASEKVDEKTDEKKAARQRDRQVRDTLQKILDQLIAEYGDSERGIEIREIAGGYRMATKPEYHDAVRGFVKSMKPVMKLSLQALETLAVIAYKQPVTAPEVSEIRGVDSGGVLGSLIGRKLITTAGRKHVIGRPILYKTTKEFLLRFGLKDLNELPSMEEFEKMAGELAEAEAEAEDAAMRSSELPLLHDDAEKEQNEQGQPDQEPTDQAQTYEETDGETESEKQRRVEDRAALANAEVVTEEIVPLAGSDLGESQEMLSGDDDPLNSLGISPSPEALEPQVRPADEEVQATDSEDATQATDSEEGTDHGSSPETLRHEDEDLEQANQEKVEQTNEPTR
jgi:segregation and condensation protein B